ncbi:MAG: type II toxin-antitoxin system YafQ family toxin [Anaerolineales bacterium]|nr:type II toxin-antitoxin system YafQ family toxin [Anaerolineales bacterium]
MRAPSHTDQFERDLRRMQRGGKDAEKIKMMIATLVNEEPLAERYRDHALTGNYKGRRECHIEPDWLLIYKLMENEIIFERTGAHSDLFE